MATVVRNESKVEVSAAKAELGNGYESTVGKSISMGGFGGFGRMPMFV